MKATKAPVVRAKVNLQQFIAEFGTEDACRAELETLRWPNGVICPRCQKKDIGRLPTRPVFYCRGCKYQFSVTAGTIFNDSHLKLSIWFYTTFLMVEAKNGMSSRQLERVLGVSHKTAWYLTHRIRAAMQEANPEPLHGIVEVDETDIGGKRMHVGRGYRRNKAMVLGAAMRGGDIRMRVERRADRKTLHKFIADRTRDRTASIMTDDWPSYDGCGDEDTLHQTVNHRAEEYVRAAAHTNTAESARSLLKRSIVGCYHRVSEKNLPAYLQEFEFRFNNRKNPYLFRDTLLKLIEAKALPYEQLTA